MLSGTICYDIVYRPVRTRFLVQAELAGAQCIYGTEMFLGQASKAFELFFQTEFPMTVASRALYTSWNPDGVFLVFNQPCKQPHPYLSKTGLPARSTHSVFPLELSPAGEQAVIPGDMGINPRSSAEATTLTDRFLLTKLGRNPANLALVKQVHGSHIVYAERHGILGEADGLVTDRPEIDLGILGG